MPSLVLPKPLQSGWQLVKRLATASPPRPHTTIGLDIGSSAVKVVALGPPGSSGARPLLGHATVMLRDSSEAQLPPAIQEAMTKLGLTSKVVTLAVSGQAVTMRAIEMPKLSPQELTQALPFEAQRHVPFNIQDVVLDGAMLGPAEGGKIWVLIVAGKREMLERRVAVVKRAGLEPEAVGVDAVALANAFLAQPDGHQAAGTQALLNLGAQWTNLAILKDRVPYLVRDVPWGASRLMRQTAEQLGVDEAAVTAQVSQGKPATPELLAALKAGCESVTADVQLSFDFFESRFGTQPDRILVSGGLSQSSSVLDALKSHLTQPVQTWAPRERLGTHLTVAYGLALRTDVA